MTVKLLTEQHFEFLNLTGDYTGSSQSQSLLFKMPHSWKSPVEAQMLFVYCRKPASGTVSLTSDRAQGNDSKKNSNSRYTKARFY